MTIGHAGERGNLPEFMPKVPFHEDLLGQQSEQAMQSGTSLDESDWSEYAETRIASDLESAIKMGYPRGECHANPGDLPIIARNNMRWTVIVFNDLSLKDDFDILLLPATGSIPDKLPDVGRRREKLSS